MRSTRIETLTLQKFVDAFRFCFLASSDANSQPHVVPVCFVVQGENAYITIDDKPKRRGKPLKRISNILHNPRVALVVDHYEEDWSKLGWVMFSGHADILNMGPEHDCAQELLQIRYPQMQLMDLHKHPVIAVRIDKVSSWGAVK